MALRCLIVDDSARFLEAASEFLKREGITVVGVASTSSEAMEQVQELRPDVALVDVDLGAESGFELARRIAEAPEPPPVILISTRSEDDLAELIARSPALGYLSKAFLSAHAIRNLLDNGKCEHEALVYTTMEEFLAATVPFIREGLEAKNRSWSWRRRRISAPFGRPWIRMPARWNSSTRRPGIAIRSRPSTHMPAMCASVSRRVPTACE